jgi:CPA2 family monovalent cation:H+ antiporter-2
VLGESELSHQSAAESLPIQNIFTVLFFVSVGMLVDPLLFLRAPVEIGILVLAICVGCGLLFLLVMLLLGVLPKIAGAASGTLAQIGEFSFILSGVAVGIHIMTGEQRGMLFAAALVSILVHSMTSAAYGRLGSALGERMNFRKRRNQASIEVPAALGNHVIVVGYGRVGRVVASALSRAALPHLVIEAEWRSLRNAQRNGHTVIFGDATRMEVLRAAQPEHARLIVVALPDPFQARRVIELARQAQAGIGVVARAHSEEEYHYLIRLGVGLVVMGEREIALSMSDHVLQQMGNDAASAQAVVDDLRARLERSETAPA